MKFHVSIPKNMENEQMGIVNIQTNQTDQCPNDSLEYPQNDQEYHYKDMGQ